MNVEPEHDRDDRGRVRALLQRLHGGDTDAARSLVEEFEEQVRREVRVRMRDPRLRALVDSADVVQSVLGTFFARMALGRYRIETSDDLVALLTKLVRNKVADAARWHFADRRDGRRTQRLGELQSGRIVDRGPGPHAALDAAELLASFRDRLTPLEREIAALRADEVEWVDVAGRLGGTPDAIRVRFQRAILRVSLEMGLGAT